MSSERSTTAAPPDIERPTGSRCRFGPFELDLPRGALTRDGQDIPIRPKTFALLSCLLAHPGRLISKEELLDHVWPGVVVTEDSVTQCVGELRAALGDGGQQLIRTVPRRGYRLDAAVRWASPDAAAGSAGDAVHDAPRPQTSDAPAVLPGGPSTSDAPAVPPADPSTSDAPTEAPAHPGVSTPRGGEDGLASGRPRIGYRFLSIALVLLTVSAGVAWWWRRPVSVVSIDQGVAAQRAVAVLPFTDLGDPPSPALARAITEDLTVALSHLGNTMTFAGTSTAEFSGGDAKAQAQAAGRLLAATHVLTGSVRRRADEVLIQVQLIRSDSGAVVWSDRFDYRGTLNWDWQRDVGQRVANALNTRLYEAYLPKGGYADREIDAIEATQRGIAMMMTARSHEDLVNARKLIEQALAVDPDSVVALTALGFSYTSELGRRWGGDREAKVRAADAAFERAIALQPGYALAYLGRSNVLYTRGRVDDAAFACEQALARWPNEPRTLLRLGFLRLQQGRPEEVEPLVRLALRLNPLEAHQVSWGHFFIGMAKFHQHRDDEAYQEMQQAVASNASNGFGWQWMAAMDALHGRHQEARVNLEKFKKLIPNHTVGSLKRTETATSPAFWAERERFYVGLAKAGLEP